MMLNKDLINIYPNQNKMKVNVENALIILYYERLLNTNILKSFRKYIKMLR